MADNPFDQLDPHLEPPAPAAIAAVRQHLAVQPVGGRKAPPVNPFNPFDQLDPPKKVGLPWEQLLSSDTQGMIEGMTPEQQQGVRTFIDARGRAQNPITALTGDDKLGASSAAAGGFLEGIPVAGKYIKEGAQRLGAHILSVQNSTPYGETLEGVKNIAQQKELEHPVAHGGGEVVGGITALAPVAAIAPGLLGADRAVSLGQNVKTAAKTGAILGAAPGLIEGEPIGDIAKRGAVGAATFGAGPLVGKGIGALAGRVSDWAATRGVTGQFKNTDPRAVQMALNAMKRDNLITDADIDRALSEKGSEAFLGEFGPNLRGYLSAIGSMTGAGKTTIFEGFGNRGEGISKRIDDSITDVLGPRVNVDDLTQQGFLQRSQEARPLYEKWHSMEVPVTQEMTVSKEPGGKGLLQWLKDEGYLAKAQKLSEADPNSRGWGVQSIGSDGKTTVAPSAATWDHIKQALDDAIKDGTKDGRLTNYGNMVLGRKEQLMEAINNGQSEGAEVWRQARKAWATPTAINEARQFGQALWNSNTRRDEFSRLWATYSKPEKDAVIEGARDSLAEIQDRSARGDTAARNVLLAKANQDKLELLAKHKGYSGQPLVRKMEQEKGYADAMSRVLSNSETASRQFAQKELSPDPTQTLTARIRHAYLPHVTPEMLIPKTLEDMAAEAQAHGYEKSRDVLAPWLMKQGPNAAEFAKALMEHGRQIKPSVMLNPSAAQAAQVLAQGATLPIPGTRQQQLQGQR